MKDMKMEQSEAEMTPYEEAVELLYQAFYFNNYEDAKNSAEYLNQIVNKEIEERFNK